MTVLCNRSVWLMRHILPHEPALRSWVRRQRVEGLEPDDVVQETYALLAALDSVAHIRAPRSYAFQTAKSVIVRHLRRQRVARIDAVGDIEHLGAELDEPSPERQVSARDELRRLRALVDGLPGRCGEAFRLRKFEGLSQREVAVRMGIAESTVEKHIARALRLLSDAHKGPLEDPPAPSEGGWSLRLGARP